MTIASSILGLALLMAAPGKDARISRELDEAMRRAEVNGESVAVVLTLKGAEEPGDLRRDLGLEHLPPEARASAIILALQGRFRSLFSGVLSGLQNRTGVTRLRGYWAGAMIALCAPPSLIRELAEDRRFDIELDASMEIPTVLPRPAPAPALGGAEPGLSLIHAPKLWELGITGEGTTIMSLDTGVDPGHPALGPSWRGLHVPPSEAWFDPVYGTETPRDYGVNPAGHGTMTMGVMVGLDRATGDTVGVAFGAEWIAAGDSTISISNQVACFQWALDPDGNPLTVDDMPDVVNCSWTRANPGCKETGITLAISALEAAGVAVVFAAGNDGPAPGSVRWPSRINKTETDVFAVGYVDGNDPWLSVAEASARGPTECTGLGNTIKPEVVAPGVDVRTTWLNGEYATVSGSSFSSPHVSGAIALLKQAFPSKDGTELKRLLMHSARDLGEEGEDNDYGSGLIDVYAAYLRGLEAGVSTIPVPGWSLGQNYPNPFNPATQIDFELPVRSRVRITVHSLLGLEVARPVDGVVEAGSHRVTFDGSGLPAGLYVCRMISGGFRESRKLLLVR